MVKSCQSGSKPARLRPLRAMPTMMAPSRVPMTTPRPPNRLVPPMTTAVMVSRLAPRPDCGLAAPMRPMRNQAPMA